jgi:small-conductance mechanosensitive channel
VSAKIESWSDGTLRRYLMYLSAAVATIPVAILYSVLAARVGETWWSALLVIIAGVISAHFGWTYAERRIAGLGAHIKETAADRILSDKSVPEAPASESVFGRWPLLVGGLLSWFLLGVFFHNFSQVH